MDKDLHRPKKHLNDCCGCCCCFSDPVLQYLLAGLQESRLASVAATALQSISTTCKDHMKSHCDGLIQIVQAVDTFNITNDAATGLLRGMKI
jgi:transportin-3